MIVRRRHVYHHGAKVLSFRHAEQCPLVTDKAASVLGTQNNFPFITVSRVGDSSSGHPNPEVRTGV